jgi:heptosyltransferase-2
MPAGCKVYLLGGPADRAIGERIAAGTTHTDVAVLVGKLSFLQSAALMAGAVMNYTNDSGPLHFASAMNAPVTAVFCSTVPAFGFGPLRSNGRIAEIEDKLSCRPCGLHGHKKCPEGHFKCAMNIKNEQLLWWTSKTI